MQTPAQTQNKLEVWLRGPLPEVPALLQPVAHALLQAREEVEALLKNFPDNLLWERPSGVASPGFHLQHLTGVLDRLFTYARQESLNNAQLAALAAEEKPTEPRPGTQDLFTLFYQQVDKAIAQLIATDETTLIQTRGVGRAQIPSTVLGLLVHAAEHTQRHVGQLLVTVRILEKQHQAA
ncbi:DinB family protein [Adhaeribacter rhizoryzae]|uniref:DinB family protein n=1 Tax=Adhaeribacter rhizoryzae TaxID=2607907 RepID=A0A5M6DJX9_9BACT|nr:DinB family protein [Adhaeribacter rhizoryzae]KAA5547763.1 DinB family protein [Adhaeribacter rhizoryzae]